MTFEEFKQACLDSFQQRENFAYFGDLESPPWGAWLGTHRDADSITRSNWEVITGDLLERFPDAFQIEGSSHWLVGWSESLRIDTSNEEAVRAAYEFQERLEDYPVIDDMHLSNLEHEEVAEYIEEGSAIGDIWHDLRRRHEDLAEFLEDEEWPVPIVKELLYDRMPYIEASWDDEDVDILAEMLQERVAQMALAEEWAELIEYERVQPPML